MMTAAMSRAEQRFHADIDAWKATVETALQLRRSHDAHPGFCSVDIWQNVLDTLMERSLRTTSPMRLFAALCRLSSYECVGPVLGTAHSSLCDIVRRHDDVAACSYEDVVALVEISWSRHALCMLKLVCGGSNCCKFTCAQYSALMRVLMDTASRPSAAGMFLEGKLMPALQLLVENGARCALKAEHMSMLIRTQPDALQYLLRRKWSPHALALRDRTWAEGFMIQPDKHREVVALKYALDRVGAMVSLQFAASAQMHLRTPHATGHDTEYDSASWDGADLSADRAWNAAEALLRHGAYAVSSTIGSPLVYILLGEDVCTSIHECVTKGDSVIAEAHVCDMRGTERSVARRYMVRRLLPLLSISDFDDIFCGKTTLEWAKALSLIWEYNAIDAAKTSKLEWEASCSILPQL